MAIKEIMPQIEEKADKFAKDLYLSLLRDGKSVYLNARGASMYPFIKNGDKIKIKLVNEGEIKIGDIVAVNMRNRNGAWFYVHRVVKIMEENGNKIYFTKGDAHKKGLDESVTIELIAGKITQVQRRGLIVNLNIPLWRYLNRIIAKLSFRHPKILRFLSRYISLAMEWKQFLFKVKNRLQKGDPLSYNTEELLLICARTDLGEELKKKVQDLIKEGLHWERFCQSAMNNGITILVYDALRTITSFVYIPRFVFDRLKPGYAFIVQQITSQYKELLGLLKLFAKKDITVMPLKGTFLAKRLYGDIAARGASADLDLLIKEADKEKALILLKRAGYFFNPDDEIRQWQWQQHIFSRIKTVMLDLHWDITMMGRSHERIEGLWRGTRRIEEAGISYYEFKEEELLLYLSALLTHTACFRQLKYICDINELLCRHKDTIDWNKVIEKAKRWKLSSSLYAALKLSKDLFDSDVPFPVWLKLKPNFLTFILIKLFINKRVILRNGVRRRFINSFLSYIFFELIEARSIKEYLSIFKRVFFPPKQVLGKRNYTTRILKAPAKLVKTLKKQGSHLHT